MTMPFEVSRQKRTSLIAQVTDGLRSAIIIGHYRPGDTLPNLQDMAAALGVSEIVTRRAVQRLAGEGLLNPRRGTGIAVCGEDLPAWQGHVLYISWSGTNMYYHNILSGVMTERLHAAGVLVSTLHIDGSDSQDNFDKVQAYLGQAISLAIIEGEAEKLDTILAERNIPFIHIHPGTAAVSPLATCGIAVASDLAAHDPALTTVQEHFLACGIRSILRVKRMKGDGFAGRMSFDQSVFAVSDLESMPLPHLDSPESVERGALRTMQQWLDARPTLPDLIWFDDDFSARGGLLVLTAHGIVIPDDVQVVSWANKGLGPVFLKPMTRVEMDPKAHGETVARCILDHLNSKGPLNDPVGLQPTFIPGETTARTVRDSSFLDQKPRMESKERRTKNKEQKL